MRNAEWGMRVERLRGRAGGSTGLAELLPTSLPARPPSSRTAACRNGQAPFEGEKGRAGEGASAAHLSRGIGIWDFRANARPGFALLDLMLSVLILGVLLVPLALSRNNVIVSAGQTVMLRKARILAAAKIGELEIEKPEELASGGGDFGAEHPGYTWEAKVETLPLWEIVGQTKITVGPNGETLSAADSSTYALNPDGTTEENAPQVIRLTLLVKFDPGEEPAEAPALGPDGEELKARPFHTIEIVRYWRKPPEEETGTTTK
jgi:hypothetical protein